MGRDRQKISRYCWARMRPRRWPTQTSSPSRIYLTKAWRRSSKPERWPRRAVLILYFDESMTCWPDGVKLSDVCKPQKPAIRRVIMPRSLLMAPDLERLARTPWRRAELSDDETSRTAANDLAVRRALETAGVEFIDENGGGPGVRLRKSGKEKPRK